MFSGILTLAVSGIGIILLTAILYKFNQSHKKLAEDRYLLQQITIGLIYGAIAICGTEFGVSIEGAVMNIRDAAPLCAALFFGGPAGIIAGFIGGLERWFAVYWGAGSYTRLACTLGTIIAGLFGAFVRSQLTENRKPGWVYATAVGMVSEVIHLLLVFLTNVNDSANAISVVRTCTPVMVTMVMLTVGGSALVISIIDKKQFFVPHEQRKLADDVQAGLMTTVFIVFLLVNSFVVIMQNHLATTMASNAISQTLEDIEMDFEDSDTNSEDFISFIKKDVANRHIGKTGYVVAVDKNGGIIASTDKGTERENAELNKEEKDNSQTIYDIELVKKMNAGDIEKLEINGLNYYCSYVNIEDYYVIGMYLDEEANLGRNVTIYTTTFFEIIILAVLFIQIYFLIRLLVVKNLRKINENLTEISSGNLDTRVEIATNEEFVSLSGGINTTVDTLKQYIAEASARIDDELKLAREIQYSTLPRVYPESQEIELYANMLAAKEVGGDFYDFYPIDGNNIALIIADVSGKGIPAALFMMKAKTLIKGLVESGASPETVLTKANEELCNSNEAGMFVTAWLGVMNKESGVLRYANAGHNPPIVIKSNKEIEFIDQRPGLVLAGLEGVIYKGYELVIEKGDTLFMYTDGVTEAINLENELYGEARLIATLRDVAGMNTRYLCRHVKDKVDEFVGEAPQFDDITMLAVRRKTDADTDGVLTLKPDRASLGEVEKYFDAFNEANDIPVQLSSKIMVIVDEVYSNIVNYSGASQAKIRCQLDSDNKRICISFEDNGIAYNPLDREDPVIDLMADEREIGGLGVFMVKKMSEDVKYSRIDGNNILDVVL